MALGMLQVHAGRQVSIRSVLFYTSPDVQLYKEFHLPASELYNTYTVMGRRGASQSSKVMWNSRVAALSAALLGVPVCSTFLLFHTAKSPRFHVSFTTCSDCTLMDWTSLVCTIPPFSLQQSEPTGIQSPKALNHFFRCQASEGW